MTSSGPFEKYEEIHLGAIDAIKKLAALRQDATANGNTVVMPGHSPPEKIDKILKTAMISMPHELLEQAVKSPNGFYLFVSDRLLLVEPPFPQTESATYSGIEIKPLVDLLSRDTKIAIILVRLGAYAIGVARNENLIASKVGTGLIHGRHRQGGSSSNRFRRRRDNQIDEFLDRVCTRIQEHIAPLFSTVDYFAYGGSTVAIEVLRRRCPILARSHGIELPPLLDVPAPRLRVLEASARRLWSTRFVTWRNVP